MTQNKTGTMLVWTDIPEGIEAEFNEWYNREHLPDRINKVPGFRRGRRFVAINGAPKYAALYETESAAVLRSEPYLAINRDPDPTSKRFIPLFKNTIKGICDTTLRLGQGEGGFLALLPTRPAPGRPDEFRSWVCDDFLPGMLRLRGVVATTFAERNSEIMAVASAAYTRSGDRYIDDLIMIEAASENGLNAALEGLAAQAFAMHGGMLTVADRPCIFQVIYTQHSEHA